MYLMELPLRYLMDQLRKLCEAALVSGVRVTRENLFDLARWWSHHRQCWSLWWMCWWCWWWWLRWRRPPPGLPESFRASNPQLGPYSPSAQDSWGFFIVPLLLSLSFAVQYHFVFVHQARIAQRLWDPLWLWSRRLWDIPGTLIRYMSASKNFFSEVTSLYVQFKVLSGLLVLPFYLTSPVCRLKVVSTFQMLVKHAEGLQLPEEEVSSWPIMKMITRQYATSSIRA